MTDEQTKQTEQEPQSVIIIEFAQPGSAEPLNIQCKAVSPGQLHAAAKRLELMANRHIQQMWAMAERRQAREATQMEQVQQSLKVNRVD